MNDRESLITAAVELAKNMVSPERFRHLLGTATTARRLAEAFGCDAGKAYLAGMLHDIAREMGDAELLQVARSKGIIQRKEEEESPILLHGKVAAEIARDRLSLDDEEVLQAISSHVSGRRNWSRLEQVVYLADKVEPGRDWPGVAEAREALDRGAFYFALEQVLRSSINYVLGEGGQVDPETVVLLNEISKRT